MENANPIDWTQIILAIIGLIGAIDLMRLLFIKEDKKQKKSETIQLQVETLGHSNEMLSAQLDHAMATIANKDKEIEALQRERADLLAAQSCLFDDMCVHKGCRLRKPHQGKGSLWYEQYKDDPTLGADYMSVDTLLKADRAQRLKENTSTEDTDNAEA